MLAYFAPRLELFAIQNILLAVVYPQELHILMKQVRIPRFADDLQNAKSFFMHSFDGTPIVAERANQR
jgi:hypothetical protein